MPPPIQPSHPSYNLSVADITNADLPRAAVQRVLAQAQAETQAGNAPDIYMLLASMLKNQQPRNARYGPITFNLAAYVKQQILTENTSRSYLLIQNVGSGDIFALVEGGSPQATDLSGNTTVLIQAQTRAVRIVAGGSYEPSIPPSNAITLFTLNTAAYGVVFEGS